MEQSKSWYKSSGVWASVGQMAVGLVVATGILTPQEGQVAVGHFDQAVGAITALLGIVSFWGRVVATKQIKPLVK